MHTYLLDNHTDHSREGVVSVADYLERHTYGEETYRPSVAENANIVGTFPIVDSSRKLARQNAFRDLVRSSIQTV